MKKRILPVILALILLFGPISDVMPVWAGSTSSDPISTWSPVSTAPTANNLCGVVCGNGLYVAVGSNGTILASANGTDSWVSHDSGTKNLNGVAYGVDSSGDSLFAAVGNGGTILTSNDGTAWVSRTSGTSENLNGITYGGGQFVAMGDVGTILTSPDGEAWEAMEDGSGNPYTGENLYSATYGLDSNGNDVLVVAGSNGAILSFLSLSDWSYNSTYSDSSTDSLYGVIFGWDSNGDPIFVAAGQNGTILSSSDGETWSSQTSGISGTLNGITYSGGQFVAVGGTGTILTSGDGAAWTSQTSGTVNNLYEAAFGGNRYVAVGDSGTIIYSDIVQAAGAAVITGVRDIGDNGNGSDLEVSFNIPNDENLVKEYQVLVVPSDEAGTFNVVKAGVAVSAGYSTIIAKTGSDITITLDAASADITGYSIENGSAYKVYVLSTADGSNAAINTLSEPSSLIELKGMLDRWNWANPKPTGNTLNGSAYANGLYVVVGDEGTILTSSDGNTWTSRTTGVTSDLAAVTYGKGCFVAVGSDGCVLTSNDGTIWNEPNTDIPWCFLTGVAYGEGLFVAVTSSNEEVYISPDGKTWTTKTAYYLEGITYGNGQFVGGGYGCIYTSNNGKTWEAQTASVTDQAVYGIASNGSGYVAVGGNGTIMTSPDGAAWSTITKLTYGGTEYSISDLDIGAIPSITYGNGRYLAVASQAVLTSTDGTVWIISDSGQQNCLYGVGYGNNLFVAVGDSGTILTSSAGDAWDSTSSGTISYLYDVIHDGSRFIAAGNEAVLTSDNGMDWSGQSVDGYYLEGAAYGNGTYVAVGSNGYPSGDHGIIMTSTDRVAWSLKHTRADSNTPLAAVAYGNGIYVAVGRNNVTSGDYGVILTSSDGSTWSGQGDGETGWSRLYSVAYGKDGSGNDLFVAVGYNGIILTSSDGTAWTEYTYNNPYGANTYALNRVTYCNGQFVAVGDSGIIITSPDGTSWSGSSEASVNLNGVIYDSDADAYVAVGDSGKILTLSADYGYWRTRDSGTSNVLNGVSCANGVYVAVGANGTILTTATGSGSTETPTTADSANNSANISPASITAGDSVTITAAGDRQSVAGAVYGDERYIPTAWTSTETGKNGTFSLTGSDYTSNYIPDLAGSYTITATFQKQTWTEAGWTDEAGSTDTKNAYLAVTEPVTADASNNSINLSASSITVGSTITITAVGDRQDSAGSVNQETRYIPYIWNSTDGSSGTFSFSEGSYKSSYTPAVTGNYTITATFREYTYYDGDGWFYNETDDTKTASLTVNEADVPNTADSAKNSVSVDPASITVGSSSIITAVGDRQSVTGAVYGDERYIPTTWISTEAGKNRTFILSGSDFTSEYTPSSAGSYTTTATFQKQTWDGSAWSDTVGSTDTKTAVLTVNEASVPNTADASNNSVSINPFSLTIGGSTTITAIGDRQSVTGEVYGDERYIPTAWTSTETRKNGTFTLSGSNYTSSYTPSSAGSYTITATFQKQTWDGSAWKNVEGSNDTKTAALTVNNLGGSSDSDDSSGTGGSTTIETSQTGLGSVTTENGTISATLDPAKLAQEISKSGPNSIIIFAITGGNKDRAVFNFTVADLKAIADNKSILQLETPYGIYKLPAVEIDFNSISKQYTGISYRDIKVTVAFSKADGTKAKLNGSRLVGQPVSIKVNLSAGKTIIELDEFTKYVERDLPASDASGFTTGVVIEEDGTLRHVPTKTVTINGKKYAAIFSRTNSIYCLISKAVSFDDMEGHWAKETVTDMASRLIISGVGSNTFAPGRDITRAEFAAIVVRALGLEASGDADFTDVKTSDWYYGAVAAAYKYGIVSGYGDGTFRPDSKITRQEAMAMVARAMKVAAMDTSITNEVAAAELAKFIDGNSFSNWAKQSAGAVIRSGLVAGSEGYARPERNITRAETAVIVKRLLEKAGLI